MENFDYIELLISKFNDTLIIDFSIIPFGYSKSKIRQKKLFVVLVCVKKNDK